MQKVALCMLSVLMHNSIYSMENEAKRVCRRNNTQVDLSAAQRAERQRKQWLTNNLFELSASTEELASLFIKDYIRQGADPNWCDHNGVSPLHRSIEAGNLPVAHVLISARARIDKLTNDRLTPLHSAVRATSPLKRGGLIRYLIACGAQKWQTPEYSPLRLAVERGDYMACIALLSSLSVPAFQTTVEAHVAEELHKLKIELTLPDENGLTLQQLALDRGFQAIAHLVDPNKIGQFRDALLEAGTENP